MNRKKNNKHAKYKRWLYHILSLPDDVRKWSAEDRRLVYLLSPMEKRIPADRIFTVAERKQLALKCMRVIGTYDNNARRN